MADKSNSTGKKNKDIKHGRKRLKQIEIGLG